MHWYHVGNGCMLLQVTLASNFFGPLYLTHLLLDVLKANAPSRIVFESSMLEQWGHVDWTDIGYAHLDICCHLCVCHIAS